MFSLYLFIDLYLEYNTNEKRKFPFHVALCIVRAYVLNYPAQIPNATINY